MYGDLFIKYEIINSKVISKKILQKEEDNEPAKTEEIEVVPEQ